MKNVFLSYSRSSEPLAIALRTEMAKLHIGVFDPARDLAIGENWLAGVKSAIRKANAVVVLADKVSDSSWATYETGMADGLGKQLLVLRPEGTQASALPAELSSNQMIVFRPKFLANAAKEIAAAIQ